MSKGASKIKANILGLVASVLVMVSRGRAFAPSSFHPLAFPGPNMAGDKGTIITDRTNAFLGASFTFHRRKCYREEIVGRGNRLSMTFAIANSTETFSVAKKKKIISGANGIIKLPMKGEGGIWKLTDKEQHKAFVAAHTEKLIVVKIFSPVCRACKKLEPKFRQVTKDELFEGLPVVFAEFTVKNNLEYIKSLGIYAMPSVQFYFGNKLLESFPCGPSKVPLLKRKMTDRLGKMEGHLSKVRR